MNDSLTRLTNALSDRYRIERELGAGGMATVFLAEDLKHKRLVALKVLKSELAAVLGADRFVQEITTTAALQHPHILPLFDSGTADGFLYYVMPFIDGETLRSKLDRETQLGIDEAVKITIAIADALDYAHRGGVIHRDIKPENILLHEGRPMVADFGIALAVSAAAGGRMTETGLSLGTPHYMSPEQATAEKEISARSDIYSLASVLYEMLTGNPPHTGASAQQIIMKIVTEEAAPVTKQRKSVPGNVAAAVAKALEKLPADRFESARAFAAALMDVHFTTAAGARSPAFAKPRRMLAGAAMLVLLAGSAGWLSRGWGTRSEPSAAPIRFATSLGRTNDDPGVAISPDGRRIMQSAADSLGNIRLVMRELGSTDVATIAGTEGAFGAEFSPDGESVAFVVDGVLKRISIRGGPATTLVDAHRVDAGRIAWASNGDIVYTARDNGLWRRPASGGPAEQVTKLDTARKEFAHWSPQYLPGERAIIYTNYATPVSASRIEALDLKTRRVTVLAEGAMYARYSPTGHLLYARDAAVFAVAFDPKKLKTRGTAVPVQDDVAWSATDGLAGYAVSANGTFVYLRDSEWTVNRTMVWRDRAGRDTPLLENPGPYAEPRLAPNGRWIALTIARPKPDIWLYDINRRVLTQITRAPSFAFNAAWLPDSRRIAYTFEDRVYELHIMPIDASEADRVLLSTPYDKYVSSFSPDGRQMLITETSGGNRVKIAPVDGSMPPRPLADSPLQQRAPSFSPDGRWFAYAEHGESRDVYIRQVDGNGGRRMVSANGGSEPRWTKGGREIVYLGESSMMSVAVDPATGEVSTATPLFSITDIGRTTSRFHSYDVTPDGERFLITKKVERSGSLPLVVVVNWRPDMNLPAGAAR